MTSSRREILSGLGMLAVTGVGATTVLGDSDYSTERKNIDIKEVNAESEYVVFVNNSDSDLDISNFVVAFDYMNPEYDQRRALPKGTTISANGTLKVATGAKDVADADVTFDYDGEVLNNDEPDTVALLTTNPVEDEAIASKSVNTSTSTTEETTTEETTTIDESSTTTTDNGGETTTTSSASNSSSDSEETDETTTSSSGSDSSTETSDSEDSSGSSSSDSKSDSESTNDDC